MLDLLHIKGMNFFVNQDASFEDKKKEGFQNFATRNRVSNVLNIASFCFLRVHLPRLCPWRIFAPLISLRSYGLGLMAGTQSSRQTSPWTWIPEMLSSQYIQDLLLSFHHIWWNGWKPRWPTIYVFHLYIMCLFWTIWSQSPSPSSMDMPLGNHTFELLQPTKSCRYSFFHQECVFSSFSHPARLYSNKLPFVKSFPAPPKIRVLCCAPQNTWLLSLLNLVMLPWDWHACLCSRPEAHERQKAVHIICFLTWDDVIARTD